MNDNQDDRLNRIAAKLAELTPPTPPTKKDFWDKVGTFSTLISTVIIGGAGLIATTLYNNHELELKHLDTVAQEQRLTKQAKQDEVIAQAKTLEALLKYIASEKPAERTFGYAMFAALGQGDLAATIIGTTRDVAGASVAKSLVNSSDPEIAKKAASALLTLDQQSRLVGAVALMSTGGEKTGYEYVGIADDKSYIVYGNDLWSLPPATNSNLKELIHDYMREPGALYVSDFSKFSKSIDSEDKSLVENVEFQTLLRKAGTDPAMVKVQDRALMSVELEPKLQRVAELGAKTPLGAAMVFYVMLHNVEPDVHEIISKTDEITGASLKTVNDEKIWIKNLVSVVCDKVRHPGAKFYFFYREKCRVLRTLWQSNDWTLDHIADTATKFRNAN